MEYNNFNTYYPDYLQHYGVKGMKWGHRKHRGIAGTIRDMQRNSANKSLSKIDSQRRQVNSELRELRGYDRNPSGLAKSKLSTAIRRSQIKSLEKTQNNLNAKAKANKDALKELDSIEKYQQAKAERKQKINNTHKELNKNASFGEKLMYNDATRKKAAKYMVDNNMSMKEATKRAQSDAKRNTAIMLGAYGTIAVASLYAARR